MADPIFADLWKQKVINDADLYSAVDAYMADPNATLQAVGDRFRVNVAAAVAASPYAQDMLAGAAIGLSSKRVAMRTAILFARPMKD